VVVHPGINPDESGHRVVMLGVQPILNLLAPDKPAQEP
jgi:hypothetical protein